MISSRNLNELRPEVKNAALNFIAQCSVAGIELLVTSTFRDVESQNRLYAVGRTLPGKIVTNAKGGASFHNYRVAFDVVPILHGKAVWDDKKLWAKIGSIGKSSGLDWAGDWHTFRELAHFQLTGGKTIAEFLDGC